MSSFFESLKQPFVRSKSHSQSAQQRDQYNRWRYYEFVSAGFSLLGLVAQTTDYELRYDTARVHYRCSEKDIGDYYRHICVLFSVISIGFQIARHYIKHTWEKAKATMRLSGDGYYRGKESVFRPGLFVDVGVLCVFPYPGITGTVMQMERCQMTDRIWADTPICYTWSELLFVLMFARVYLILRCLFVYYSLMDRHSRFTAAQFAVKANTRFTIQSLVRIRPYTMLLLFWIPISMILAIMIRVFERPYIDCTHLDYDPYSNALWLAMMTITTVNYADFYPTTHYGRIVAMLAGIWGLFLISMMVIIMSRSFSLTIHQQQALYQINVSRHAAKVIVAAFLTHIAKKNHGSYSANYQYRRTSMMGQIDAFKRVKNTFDLINEEMLVENSEMKPVCESSEGRMERLERKMDGVMEALKEIKEIIKGKK